MNAFQNWKIFNKNDSLFTNFGAVLFATVLPNKLLSLGQVRRRINISVTPHKYRIVSKNKKSK